jgi:hypothetical protein
MVYYQCAGVMPGATILNNMIAEEDFVVAQFIGRFF